MQDRTPPGRSHSLKVNEVSVPVLYDDVLRLKIAMDQNSRQTRKTFRDFAQSWKSSQLFAFGIADLATATKIIVEEVLLLPSVKSSIELRGQMLLHFYAHRFRQSVKLDDFVER